MACKDMATPDRVGERVWPAGPKSPAPMPIPTAGAWRAVVLGEGPHGGQLVIPERWVVFLCTLGTSNPGTTCLTAMQSTLRRQSARLAALLVGAFYSPRANSFQCPRRGGRGSGARGGGDFLPSASGHRIGRLTSRRTSLTVSCAPSPKAKAKPATKAVKTVVSSSLAMPT